jgi:hypothetical protein
MSGLGWELVTVVDPENPVVGDLRVSGTRLARLADRPAAVAQAVRVCLQWWLGDWSFDTRRGVPYLEELFVAGVTEATIRAVLRRQLERIQDVDRVEGMDVTIDRATSSFRVDRIDVVTVDGVSVPVEIGEG